VADVVEVDVGGGGGHITGSLVSKKMLIYFVNFFFISYS